MFFHLHGLEMYFLASGPNALNNIYRMTHLTERERKRTERRIVKIAMRLSDYPGALLQCLFSGKKGLWLVAVLFLFSQSRAAQGDVGVLIGLMSIIIEPSRCSTVPGDYLWMAASSIWVNEKKTQKHWFWIRYAQEVNGDWDHNKKAEIWSQVRNACLMREKHMRRWPPAAIWVVRKDQ